MKQVILRFSKSVPISSEDAARDTLDFYNWQWSGSEETEMPSAYELGSFRGERASLLRPVRYTPEDADALMKTLRVAERIVVVDYAAVAREKTRKRLVAERMPAPKPASREQVPPSLRFLLCDEARAEAERYYRETELFGPVGLRNVADNLADRYPFMARLDECLNGAIRQCLRTGAEVHPPPGGPYPWRWCGISVAIGNPQGSARQVEWAMETMAKFPPRRQEVSSTSRPRPYPTVTRTEGGETYYKPRDVSEEVFAAFPAEHLHLLGELARRAFRGGRNQDPALREWLASSKSTSETV